MKIVFPYLSTYSLSTVSHNTIITDSEKVLCLHKNEDGTWLNAKWEGRGVYNYIVEMINGSTYYVTEETFNRLEREIYGTD